MVGLYCDGPLSVCPAVMQAYMTYEPAKCNTTSLYNPKRTCAQCEDVDKSLESVARPVNAIIVHCRINDIRRKDPKSASKSLVKSLRGIMKDHFKIKVIISKLPPVKNPNLQVKQDLFYALVFSELMEETDVSFVAYENLHQLSEGHHSSKKQGVVYPCKKSRQTYSQFILGNAEDRCQTCSSVTI